MTIKILTQIEIPAWAHNEGLCTCERCRPNLVELMQALVTASVNNQINGRNVFRLSAPLPITTITEEVSAPEPNGKEVGA